MIEESPYGQTHEGHDMIIDFATWHLSTFYKEDKGISGMKLKIYPNKIRAEMEMHKVFRMNGGEDEASYAKNSSHQRLVLMEVKPILEKCIQELFCDIVPPDCIKVADLGCSSGPNTFLAVQEIIESIDKECSCHLKNHQPPMIQAFLNDLVSNDFNNVFKSLPQFYEKIEKENGRTYGSCLIAAMPGSFYGKLFPESSMHFFHSSYSLHWLSQVPSGLVTESGIPLNKGSIYFAKTSPPIVHEAYLDQFTQDFTMFLRMRSQETVQHGQLLLTFLCKDCEEVDDDSSHFLYLLGMALSDMVVEGCIEEEKLDSFNIPLYTPSVYETKQIIENEGSFKITRLQTFKTPLDASFSHGDHHPRMLLHDDDDDHYYFTRATYVATYLRAVYGPFLTSHFGEAIMDNLFHRFANKLVKNVQMGEGSYNNLVISLRKQ